MSYQVHLMGIHKPSVDFPWSPPVLRAIFSDYETAYAYINRHTVDVEDGDGRKVGQRYTGVLDGFYAYDLAEVLIDPD